MQTGTCTFCGASQMIEIETEDGADVEATKICCCEEGRPFRRMAAAEVSVQSNFKDFSGEVVGIVNRLVRAVNSGTIVSAAVKLSSITRATVALTSKDKIQIVRTDTEVGKEEI